MSRETTTTSSSPSREQYTQLHLSSGNGPIIRSILTTPPRDALPSEIPIIDVSDIFSASLAARQAVAKQVHAAATTAGFFYIKNHSIPSSVIDNAYAASLDFFRQPLELKEKANIKQSKYFNGYKPAKTQRINPSESLDHREGFSWTYDPTFDPSVPSVQDIPAHISQHLRIETFHWTATSHLPNFQDSVITYWRHTLRLARALLKTFSLALSLPEDFFLQKSTHPDAALALNYYPPLPSTAGPDDVSIGSHTDFQLFTILYQPPCIRALQVLSRESQWLYAPGIKDTLVVNIADYMQRITNDMYSSTVHRAVNASGYERVSMPFFFGFNLNETCGVLDSCVGNGRKYEEVGCEEWVARRARAMHDVRGLGKK